MSAVKKFDVPLYFDPKRAGESLVEVSNDVLQTKKHKVASRWFQGEAGTDLFTWQDLNGNFIKVQLTYCGQIFEWNIVNGVRTGVIVEEDASEEVGVKGSEVIQFDDSVVEPTVAMAMDLFKNVAVVEESFIEDLLQIVKSNKTIDSMSQEDFWKTYGYSDVKYSNSKSLLGLRILWYHIRKFFHKFTS